MSKRMFGALALGLALLAPAAQAFPDNPIRIVVPFSPGGGTDILARQVAEALATSEQWNVVVENRPGGNGAVALGAISRAPADGHQIILALRENIVIAPLLNKSGGVFDPLKDFTPIVHVADAPMVVAAAPNSAYSGMKQALEAAKAKPDTLRFGTSGQGSMSHLLLAMLGKRADVRMIHVPYKGSNPALTDLVGGHVELVGGSIASAKSFIDGGRVKPLAVSSLARVAALPDVPTIAELGYDGFDVVTWYGFFGPAGMPGDVVRKLNEATNKVLRKPEMQRVLAEQGMQTKIGSPEDFDRTFRADYIQLSEQMQSLNMAAE
ncbi:Bug family tripartite tricarboxylate transporter substrate binding protein [Bordetella petrii]|uniref:Bug family tripartite tricarboxylate transporter substrate binding protein n=1 Tax=Bordetella petrii TaxID=94624 RepID=UPI0037307812